MTEFETRLSAGLRVAAETAPPFPGLRDGPGPRGRGGRSRRLLPAVLLAAVVAGTVTGGVLLAGADDERAASASCASQLRFDGRSYHGWGDPVRSARPGPTLGSGTVPGCDAEAGRPVTVSTLPGAEPQEAVLADGSVWLATGVRQVPEAVAVLEEPVPCTRGGSWTVSGHWVSVSGPMPEADFRIALPFTARIEADAGEGLPLERFSSVIVPARVTARTVGGTDFELTRAALGGGARVEVEVRCVDGRFVARSITGAG